MFCRNLKYYRLKNKLSVEEFAEKAGIAQEHILRYEDGTEKPDLVIVRKLSNILGINLSDFLRFWRTDIVVSTEEDDYDSITSECIQMSIEEHFGRFFTLLDIIGVEKTGKPFFDASLSVSDDPQDVSGRVGAWHGLEIKDSSAGLLERLENMGILICFIDAEPVFSGKSGTVNGVPFIALNSSLDNEQIKKVVAKELISILMSWDENLLCFETGKKKADVLSAILSLIDSIDMEGKEEPKMFRELTLRAISQGLISERQGADLLGVPYETICAYRST